MGINFKFFSGKKKANGKNETIDSNMNLEITKKEKKKKEKKKKEKYSKVGTGNGLGTIAEDIKENSAKYEVTDEKTIKYDSVVDRARFLTDQCEQILETSRQLDEMKVEYQAVTSYLTDIQKIDHIDLEEREVINDTARKIITITRERAKYQNNTRKITDSQYKHIAKYEDILPTEMKKMRENEAYHNTIKTDMQHLEGEKGSLYYQIEEIDSKQNYLKKIATATCVLVSLLFVLFVIVNRLYEANIQIPFLMTVVMAFIAAIYIFTNSKNNKRDMKLAELKLNKAIGLLNKVKIKYINNTNALDYSYQKYAVNSYAELLFLWEQYVKAKEDEKLFKRNTEELQRYNRELVRNLRRYGLDDPDIWVFQAVAIIDNKEMVEVRHRLNVRRQKLRERIDYNNKLKDKSIQAINEFLSKNPDKREEVTEAIKKYGIYL
ncbi:MAG: putative rane protein [Anaerocolumna sp.]|jgi:hypothetical protein|nr:putative rane protein [Anaerocolumna sp.]